MAINILGILAHVDAGKTSLTERILLETGASSASFPIRFHPRIVIDEEWDLLAAYLTDDPEHPKGQPARRVRTRAKREAGASVRPSRSLELA